jgi:hypothetical protein
MTIECSPCKAKRLGYQVVEAVDGMAKVVRVLVAPASKVSRNNRRYERLAAKEEVLAHKSRLLSGYETINFYGHPNMVIDAQTHKYAGYNQKTNLPISKELDIEWLANDEVWSTTRFTLDNNKSIEYAQKAYRGEPLGVSWRADADCTGANKTGTCYMTDFDGWDWLKEDEIPGFEGAGEYSVVECGCQRNNTDIQISNNTNINETNLSNLETTTDKQAGDISSGIPKGDNPQMPSEKSKKTAEEGNIDKKALALKMHGKGMSWDEIESGLALDPTTANDIMRTILSGGEGEPSGEPGEPPADGEPSGEPSTTEPETEALGFKTLKNAVKKRSEADGTKPGDIPSSTERRQPLKEPVKEIPLSSLPKPLQKVAKATEETEKRAETATEFYKRMATATESKKFGHFDLTDVAQFPPSKINEAVTEAIGKIEKDGISLESALAVVETHLGIMRKAQPVTEGVLKGEVLSFSTIEASGKSEIEKTLAQIHEKTDEVLASTTFGRERLDKVKGLQKNKYTDINKPIAEKLEKQYLDKHAAVLVEAANIERQLARGQKPNTERMVNALVEAGYDTKEVTETANLLGATQLRNQAFLSPVIIRRAFEESSALQLTNVLGAEKQVGDEFRFPIQVFTGSNVAENDLVIQNEGVDPIPEYGLDLRYDSAVAVELAAAVRLSKAQTNKMLNGPINYDILAQISAELSLRFERSVSKRLYVEWENQGRRYGSTEIAGTENVASTEIVNSNSINITDPSGNTRLLTYHTDVTHIVRLKCGQAGTGQAVLPRFIVKPTYLPLIKEDGSKDVNNYINKISMTLPSSTALVLGYIHPVTKNITAYREGETPNCAVDWNQGLLLFNAASNVTTVNRPTNVRYSYNDKNVIYFDLTIPAGSNRGEHYSKLVTMFQQNSAAIWGLRQVRPNLAIMSSLIGQGVVPFADEFRADSGRVDAMLAAGYAEQNTVGRFGSVDMFATNAELPSGNDVIVLTQRYSTAYGVAETMSQTGPEPAFVLGANNAVRRTTAETVTWRMRDAMKSPRPRNQAGTVWYNEPTLLIHVYGPLPSVVAA